MDVNTCINVVSLCYQWLYSFLISFLNLQSVYGYLVFGTQAHGSETVSQLDCAHGSRQPSAAVSAGSRGHTAYVGTHPAINTLP